MSFRTNIAAAFNLVGLKPPLSLEADFFAAIGKDDAAGINALAALDPSLLTALPEPGRGFSQTPASAYMMHALDNGKFVAAQALAKLAPVILNAPDGEGMTFPMFYARRASFAKGITGLTHLLNPGITDATDKQGNKLLHYAAMNRTGLPVAASFAPFMNKDANAPNKKGETPLMLAAANGTKGDLLMLIGQKADLKTRDNDGVNATMHAIRHSNLKNAITLMKLGGEVDFSDPAVETQLRVATFEGDFEFGQVVGLRKIIQQDEKRAADMLREAQEKKDAILREEEALLKQKKLVGDITAAVRAGTKALLAPEKAVFAKRPRAI